MQSRILDVECNQCSGIEQSETAQGWIFSFNIDGNEAENDLIDKIGVKACDSVRLIPAAVCVSMYPWCQT